MKHMTLSAIAYACRGLLVGEIIDDEAVASGVVIDSRQVKSNYIFIATKGERVDGHQFIQQAFIQGALGVVCEAIPSGVSGPCIVVDDSLEALRLLAKWYRTQLDIKCIGITGSAGKTSTKECISSVLEQKYSVLKTQGNLNNEIGLPLTILQIRDHHVIAVLEMGISAFGEMEVLSDIAKPDVCVITNIGDSHLEQLGSREGVLQAKKQIFLSMNPHGIACIYGDDPLLKSITSVHDKQPITYGLSTTNKIYATDITSNGLLGSTFQIHDSNQPELTWNASITLPGNHMIVNALAATAVGLSLEMTMEDIIKGLAAIPAIDGRSNVIKKQNITIIDDCYNANPSSMKAAIDLLASTSTRKIAILGDMKELGANELALHYDIGEYTSQANIDVLLCVGELSKSLVEGAGIHLNHVVHYESKEQLLLDLSAIVQPKDTVLVKASHSMGFDSIVSALDKFEFDK